MLPRFSVTPRFDNRELREWLQSLPELCASASPEQNIPGGRNQLLKLECDGKPLVVKRFRNRGAWKKLAYRVSTSKALRSFEHSARLIEAGLRSPAPVAWREDWEGPWLSESYYVCEYLEFEHDAAKLSDATLEDRLGKAALVGRCFGRMHEAGIAHLDLNFGNLLFARDETGEWQVNIIDNNRMRFGAVSLDRGIALLLPACLEAAALDSAIEAYARTRAFSEEECRALYLEKRRRFQLKWRIKDATRPWRRRVGL